MGIFAIADIISGAITAWNAWRAEKRDDKLTDTGRKLQVSDNLQASVKGDVNAQITAEDVRRIADADLDRELRGEPAAGADRK